MHLRQEIRIVYGPVQSIIRFERDRLLTENRRPSVSCLAAKIACGVDSCGDQVRCRGRRPTRNNCRLVGFVLRLPVCRPVSGLRPTILRAESAERSRGIFSRRQAPDSRYTDTIGRDTGRRILRRRICSRQANMRFSSSSSEKSDFDESSRRRRVSLTPPGMNGRILRVQVTRGQRSNV